MKVRILLKVIQLLFVSAVLLISSCSKPDDDYTPTPSSSSSSRTSTTSSALQCKGITQDGTRCERNTTDPSGYCWQHD